METKERYGSEPDISHGQVGLSPVIKTPSEGAWESQLVDYALFVRKNSRLPKSSQENRDENLLAIWMCNQKTFLRTNRLSDERIALLDLFVPSWQVRKRQRPSWDEGIQQVKDFIAVHQRIPNRDARDPYESFIGGWLDRNKENRTAQRDRKNDERVAILDREFPGWRNDPKERRERAWDEKLAALQAHVIAHGRTPLIRVSLPDEEKLAQWFYGQQQSFLKGKLSQQRIDKLDRDVPIWRPTGKRQIG